MELSRELMGGSLLKLFHGFEDVRFHHNASLGYTAIIAVHSTVLGPSLGGCRRMPYRSLWEAFFDVSRLARGMTYKAALAGLPLGGGKCVMIPRKHSKRLRAQQFRDLGSVVASMGGIYISAEDVGTTVADIDEMATTTSSVCGNMPDHPHHGNPSPFTAEGVLYGMLGALRAQNGPTAVLANRSVYVEGLGKVGFALAELLHREGAVLYVSNRTDTEARQGKGHSCENCLFHGAISFRVDGLKIRSQRTCRSSAESEVAVVVVVKIGFVAIDYLQLLDPQTGAKQVRQSTQREH